MGLNGCPVANLIFTNAVVSEDAVLQDESAGTAIAERLGYLHAVVEATQTVGIAKVAAVHAAGFAKHRVQLHHPITHREAIQTMVADMAPDAHLAWLDVRRAARLADQGSPFEVEAAIVKSLLGRFG